MLLFQTSADKRDQTTSSVVISARTEVIDTVCNQLEMRNVDNLVRHQIHPEQFDITRLTGNIKYLIFDIENSEHGEEFITKVELLISKETVCIAIGNNDSIVLAGKYQALGVHYVLHHADQMSKLGNLFDNQADQLKWTRSSLKVCILSCKGGVGGSSISYHLANSLVEQRNVSLLLVQGLGGTKNFDLIAKKEIGGEVTKLQDNFSVIYEQQEHRWNFAAPLYDSYDFVLFDHTLYNAESAEIESALTHANCLILVCNHDLASIRNAKQLLDYHQHLQSTISGVKKIILCFNENQPKVMGAITRDEAASLLGQPIDMIIPYMRSSGDPANPLTFTGKNKIILQQLTNLTLGRKVTTQSSGSSKGLFGFAAKK